MIIYTQKLEGYIRKVILPIILMDPTKYKLRGSFRRKIPYVTDVDISSYLFPDINKLNLYEKLIHHIDTVLDHDNIILYQIKCGYDDRFKPGNYTEDDINTIRPLLTVKEASMLDIIISKHSSDPELMNFLIGELIWSLYRIRWSIDEVVRNKKILRGGVEVKFSEALKNDNSFIMHFFVDMGEYPIGFDVVTVYDDYDFIQSVTSAHTRNIRKAVAAKEYYFMLFLLKKLINDKNVSEEISDIVDKKYGLYKQLLVRIESYHKLFVSGNLTYGLAKKITISIIKDIRNLTGFETDIIDMLKKAYETPDKSRVMVEWDVLLETLYAQILKEINDLTKDDFIKYYKLAPDEIKERFGLDI